jgi:TolB-like protein
VLAAAVCALAAAVALLLLGRTGTETTIAVLPFQNFTGTTDKQYFCEGLTEELTVALARVSSFRVILTFAVRGTLSFVFNEGTP